MHKRTKLKLPIHIAVVVALLVAACANRPRPFAEKDAALLTSTNDVNDVAQVDGQINPSDVLQIRETIEPNTESELLTQAGAVSPQGDRIIQVLNSIQPERSVVTLLDANGNQRVNRELQWLVGPVKFSPDGQRVITSGSDRTTRIWDGQLNQIASFDGHQELVQTLQVSPDGNYILTTEYPDLIPTTPQPVNSNVATARVLDLQATQLASFQGLPVGSSNDRQYVQFGPDSQHLLAVIEGVVQLTDLRGTPRITFNQDQQKFGIAQFSPDGRFVVAASQDTMRLWDVQGNLKAEFSNWTLTPDENIESVQLNHDARLIATGSSTGLLRLWNAQSNQVVTVQAHDGIVHAIAISPDGTQIATLGEKQANFLGDNDIRLWNLQGQLLEVFEADLSDAFGGTLENLASSFSVQFAPDGTQIIASSVGLGTTLRWKL